MRTLTAVVALSVAAAPGALAASFDLSKTQSTGMGGVSPFAVSIDPATDRVFHSAGEAGGWLMSECTVGGSCTNASLPPQFGSDYTQVTLADGTLRAYFVNPAMDGGKEITTARVDYVGGVPQLSDVTGLGIKASPEQRAWGVPDSVVTPDGRVRLYWVESGDRGGDFQPTGAQRSCLVNALGMKKVSQLARGKGLTKKAKKALQRCDIPTTAFGGSRSNEVIASATSTDASGTAFVRDTGLRFTGGYVDSDVIQARTGDWVALVSTGPGDPPQRLFVATSNDGLSWKVGAKPLTPSSFNALDPTAVQLGPDEWRVYYAKSPKATPFANHEIVVGTLTR